MERSLFASKLSITIKDLYRPLSLPHNLFLYISLGFGFPWSAWSRVWWRTRLWWYSARVPPVTWVTQWRLWYQATVLTSTSTKQTNSQTGNSSMELWRRSSAWQTICQLCSSDRSSSEGQTRSWVCRWGESWGRYSGRQKPFGFNIYIYIQMYVRIALTMKSEFN